MAARQLTVCFLERQSHIQPDRARTHLLHAGIDDVDNRGRVFDYGQGGASLLREHFLLTSWRNMLYARN